MFFLMLLAATATLGGALGLQPSTDYSVAVNGEDVFVYLATVPGPTGSHPIRMNVCVLFQCYLAQQVPCFPSTKSHAVCLR